MYRPLLLATLLVALPALAQDAPPTLNGEALPDTVVISAEKPGPGLWKIAKGDHVLWIFGTYAPLPKDVQWRSRQVERILGEADEVLLPPRLSAGVGILRGLTLLPRLIGIQKNPDKRPLQDHVPADAYARWLVLKDKYIGRDDGVEQMRPFFAAEILHSKGLEKAGLTSSGPVLDSVVRMAKERKVKVSAPQLSIQVDEPGAKLTAFKSSDMDDVGCFVATLDRLEADLDTMRRRADAWAHGDVGALAQLGLEDRDAACFQAMRKSAGFREMLEANGGEERMHAVWLEAATKAFERNRVTLAVLPIRELLNNNALLAQLREQGYTVESPE